MTCDRSASCIEARFDGDVSVRALRGILAGRICERRTSEFELSRKRRGKIEITLLNVEATHTRRGESHALLLDSYLRRNDFG